jgi:hypothetical protein
MTALADLQQAFQRAVVDGDYGFRGSIEQTDRVSADERISIYHDAYRLRLLEVLEDNYLGLAYLLGDEQFEALGRAYIDHQPSEFKSIRWFGDKLSLFLTEQPAYREQAVLAEMASADWTLTLAMDAADDAAIGIEAMAAFQPEQWPNLHFSFQPSVHRLDLYWSVLPFRGQVEANVDQAEAPTKSEYPTPWLIWRQELQVKYRSMDVDEAWALDAARNQADFSELCAGITEWIDPEHAAGRIVEFLKRWLIDELITDVGV